ncbi:nitroreductase family protein [Butyrivibrio sp.]|nr:nitroreductase family protein [Butyrivibrio sp.]
MSVRKYEDKTVEKDKIEMILRAAMAAPSVAIKKLSECSP